MEKQPRSLATAKQPATLCTSEKALGSILYYSNRTGLGDGEVGRRSKGGGGVFQLPRRESSLVLTFFSIRPMYRGTIVAAVFFFSVALRPQRP